MKITTTLILALIVFCAPAFSQQLILTSGETVEVRQTILTSTVMDADGRQLSVITTEGQPSKPITKQLSILKLNDVGPDDVIQMIAEDKDRNNVTAKFISLGESSHQWGIRSPGDYWIELRIRDRESGFIKDILNEQIRIDGDVPDPDDDKVDPDNESPFEQDGLRVMIVYESSELAKWPSEQSSILASETVALWLNSNCAKDENGYPLWRIFDQDVTGFSSTEVVWKTAMSRKRGSLPWILIGDGSRGYEGPLPKNVAETVELLKKFEPKD